MKVIRLITFILMISAMVLASISCVSSRNLAEREIIILCEKRVIEIINDFNASERTTIRKYRNRRFQLTGEVYNIEIFRLRGGGAVTYVYMSFEDIMAIFSFGFENYNHHNHILDNHPTIRRGSKVIIQGSLIVLRKFRMHRLTIACLMRITRENYSVSGYITNFVFNNSKIIEIVDSYVERELLPFCEGFPHMYNHFLWRDLQERVEQERLEGE